MTMHLIELSRDPGHADVDTIPISIFFLIQRASSLTVFDLPCKDW